MGDFLKECMDSSEGGDEVTVEEFETVWCQRCLNNDCKRSEGIPVPWTERMNRQEKALEDPEFGKPDNFQEAHNQAFISYTEEKSDEEVYSTGDGGFRSWSEEGEIHKEDPPTKEKSSQKLDETIKSLEGDSEEDTVEEQDEEQEQSQKEVQKEKSEKDGPQEQEQPESDENVDREEEDLAPGDMPDQSGKVLDKPDNYHKGDHKEPSKRGQSRSDDWSVEDDDGSVTVNISKGEKVDE